MALRITRNRYLKWRSKYAQAEDDIFEQLAQLSDADLMLAFHAATPGLVAERLAPAQSAGDFHLAIGYMTGLLYKRGLTVEVKIGAQNLLER